MVDLDWRARRFLSRRAGSVKKSFQMLRSKARFGLSFRLLLARSQASLTSLKVSSNVRMSVCDCCIRADTSGETKSAQASESARKNNLLLFPRYLTKHYWDTVNMHFRVVQMRIDPQALLLLFIFSQQENAQIYPILNLFWATPKRMFVVSIREQISRSLLAKCSVEPFAQPLIVNFC